MRKLNRFAMSLLLFASCASQAYTGGVTTYNIPPAAPSTVQRVNVSTAFAGAERDATYQRTMRTAQTAAVASKAAVSIVRGLAGTLMTVGTLAILASDVHGIWTRTPEGVNVLTGTKETSICVPNAAGCAPPQYSFRSYKVVPYGDGCAMEATDYGTNFSGYWCFGSNKKGAIVGNPFTDDELATELQKVDRLPKLLDDLTRSGAEIPWEPEVEDMPKPIVLAPRTTTHPDGSKQVTQTTLEPFTGPDGKTINWRKVETDTQISAPDSTGKTTSSTTRTETDKGESKPVEAPAVDSALPGQPKLYTPKYPDGLVGVWKDQKAALNNSPFSQLAAKLMPDVPAGGTCPSMRVDMTFSSWANFGSRDVAPPCFVWDWAKVIVLLGALIAARALIFGG